MQNKKLLIENFYKFSELESENNDEVFKNPTIIIKNDVERTYFHFSQLKNDKGKIQILKKILYEVLKKIKIEYTQGMSEIASVFIEAIFSDDINNLKLETKNPNKESISDESKSKESLSSDLSKIKESNSEPNKISGKKVNRKQKKKMKKEKSVSKNVDIINSLEIENENNKKIYEDYFHKNINKINKVAKNFNIFIKLKHYDLVKNGFSLYKKYNKVFIKLMKKNNIKIDETESLSFMNVILTFFTREIDNTEILYEIYNLIIKSDNKVLFVILSILYKDLESNNLEKSNKKKLIEKLPDSFYSDVKEKTLDFNSVLAEVEKSKSFHLNYFLIAGAAVSFIGFAAATYLSKNKKGSDK